MNKSIIKQPRVLLFVILSKGILNWLPDKFYLKLLFKLKFDKKLNFKNPVTYNEKLQWLKINDRKPVYVKEVDKYEVRSIIENKIGKDYLVPIIGVYNTIDEIPWDALPNKFVLKCTHGTHCSFICRDKNKLNIPQVEKSLKKWLKHNYYHDAREWPYRDVQPRILCEENIEKDGECLVDYKFMCFDGKVKLILVHQDIGNENGRHTLDLYTPEWEWTTIEWGIPRSDHKLAKPICLDECIRISELLSKGHPHVRVDLYIQGDKVYFGELTLYTAAGFKMFNDPKDDLMIGNWLTLPNKTY